MQGPAAAQPTDRHPKQVVSIALEPSTLRAIEAARGHESRSSFIGRVLADALRPETEERHASPR